MSAGWVAAAVRARLLLRRRLGPERALAAAASPSLRDALSLLAGSAYGRETHPGLDLAAAQRAVAAALLLQLRVLAGWLPPGGLGLLRALAAWFELVNIEDRLAYLLGAELRTPFDLGSLATAREGVRQAQSPPELRAALADSVWGDPGGETAEAVHLGLRLAWAQRVGSAAPELAELVAGAVALLLARELFVAGRPLELLAGRRALPGVGSGWLEARTLGDLGGRLPARAAWALEGVEAADGLWRAEAAWWGRAQRLGGRLAHRPVEDRAVVAGTAVLFAADAWRACAALGLAGRSGDGELREALREAA